MNNIRRLLAAAAVILATAQTVGTVAATEGVAGRYIPGSYAGPGAGIVPPMPGAYWAVSSFYYHGEAGGNVPFGNNEIALGLEADMWSTIFAGVYVPEIDLPATGPTRCKPRCRSAGPGRLPRSVLSTGRTKSQG
jgi:hypothetical protein